MLPPNIEGVDFTVQSVVRALCQAVVRGVGLGLKRAFHTCIVGGYGLANSFPLFALGLWPSTLVLGCLSFAAD